MAWETRGNRDYLYRKKRVNGRVVSEYLGTGYHAKLLEMRDARTAAQRNAEREERRRQDAIDKEIKRHSGELRKLVNSVLVASGYHQHKRQWRKKRMLIVTTPSDLVDTMKKTRGKKQSSEQLTEIEASIAKYPEAAAKLGNLSVHTQASMLKRIFGDTENLLKLSVLEHTNQVRRNLGYDDVGAIEKAIIDHVVVCWLRLYETESRYESLMREDSVTITRAEHWEKRLEIAQRRYLRAVESFAKVRRLLSAAPLAQFNFNSQVANIGSIQK